MVDINYRKIVEALAELSDRFNDWELGFICDMYNKRPYGYTDKEQECIKRMNNKYRKSN